MKLHLGSTFAFASILTAVISIGASAWGNAHAQSLPAQHSGSAYFGPFGEPPMVIHDTAVMGGGDTKTVESAQGNPDIRTTSGEPSLMMIKRAAEMGNAAVPAVEPFESNFPETKPAE